LQTAIEALSVEGVTNILSTFSCSINDDIERFLKEKSIEFSNKGIARTHLVLFDSGSRFELMGYYTLTNKILSISPEGLSNSTKKRVERFGVIDSHTGLYNVPTPLIAQLGKNFSSELSAHINGDELLQIACDKVVEIQDELGCKLVYIECDNTKSLIDFYSRNNFNIMESGRQGDNELIQMIRFL
jgi:hypothetical protein